MLPTFADVTAAAARILPYIHHPTLITSQTLNRMTGAELYFKPECFQKVGAFKARGACNAVFALEEAAARRGVITHSSGNHGAALAYAAALRGIPAIVVMPEDAPPVKRAAVAGYGAQIVTSGSLPQDRERRLDEILAATGATFIHPSNNFHVIAGQGTAALELIAATPVPLEILLTPVGGGGLLAGTALAASGRPTPIKVIAAEPEQADDAARSFRDGRIYLSEHPQTIADGLRTNLGDLNFPIIREHVSEILTVTEAGIIKAMRLVWERMKIIIEPSSAVPVAALFEHPDRFHGRRVGVILSGGNVDLDHLPWK